MPTAANQNGLWSDLPRRVLVLLIGIPVVGVILARPTTAWLFFQGVHLCSAWEWLVLIPPVRKYKDDNDEKEMAKPTTKKNIAMYLFPLISCAVSNVKSKSGNQEDGIFMLSLMAVACFYCLVESSNSNVSNHMLKGLFFITIPMRAWNQLCLEFSTTSFLLSVVWNCDTGALLVGRLSKAILGNNRIPPPQWLQRISPAKSVEGILGGIFAGSITSVVWPTLWRGLEIFVEMVGSAGTALSPVAVQNQPLMQRLLLGLLLSILGILGDLWESSTKRQGFVKDSGKLLPGHGGVLDRFDSSLLPVLFYKYYYAETS